MEYEEFKRQLGKASLSVREFAELVKLSPASISNYSTRGKVPDHLGVIAALIAELAEHKVPFRDVFGRLTLSPNKPRGISAKHGSEGVGKASSKKRTLGHATAQR